MSKNKKFIFSASGIFLCYLYFGLVQEDVTKSQYKLPDGSFETFVYPTALVFLYCFVNFIFSNLLSISIFKDIEDTTKIIYYCLNALSYLLAMICGNMSLQFINYPTHVVGKTVKPICVMMIGALMGKKNYSFKKYCFVILIISGAVLFMYKDKGDSLKKKGFSLGLGELLLFLSLLMDGFTAGIQERMLAEHQTKSISLMVNINKWATLYSGIIILLTGELLEFVEFVRRHPFVLAKLLTLSLASSLGQYFIFINISEFGPLPCSIVTTLRKFFTVLISVILMGNTLLPRQWLGTVIIFIGLFLDIYYGKSTAKSK